MNNKNSQIKTINKQYSLSIHLQVDKMQLDL